MLAALVLHVATRLSLDSGRTHALGACKIGDVRTIFFLMKNDYPEMISFMASFGCAFQLNVHEITVGFKQGLFELMEGDREAGRDVLKAMFMGTRRDDPDGRLQPVFSPTDPSWPPLCRVNPILEFQYHDIWQFLRIYGLPYCSLYDRGYTSIGTVDDTTTNELLWIPRLQRYAHPWLLPHGKYERIGRGCRRFFATRHTINSFLDYPTETLAEITKYLELRPLTRLALTGNKRLASKMGNGAVTEIRHTHMGGKTRFCEAIKLFGQIRAISCVYQLNNRDTDSPEHEENIYMHLPSTLTSLSVETIGPDLDFDFPESVHLPKLRHLSASCKDAFKVEKLVNSQLQTLVLQGEKSCQNFNLLLAQLPRLTTLAFPQMTGEDKIQLPPQLETLVMERYHDTMAQCENFPKTLTFLAVFGAYQNGNYSLDIPPSITSLNLRSPGFLPQNVSLNRLKSLKISSPLQRGVEPRETPIIRKPYGRQSNKHWPRDFAALWSCGEPSSLMTIDASQEYVEFDSGSEIVGQDTNSNSWMGSSSWPPTLTDLNFVLRLVSGNADLARLPAHLKRLHIYVPGNVGEVDLSRIPQQLTSLSLSHTHLTSDKFQLLPRALQTLRIASKIVQDECEMETRNGNGDCHIIIRQPEHFVHLPPGLTYLSMLGAEAFAPTLPFIAQALTKLKRLELEDNSICDSNLHLLPRQLEILALFGNTQVFCKRLADLPRSLTEIHIPGANHNADHPTPEQLDHLPLSIRQLQLGTLPFYAEKPPTPLFSWPVGVTGQFSISDSSSSSPRTETL